MKKIVFIVLFLCIHNSFAQFKNFRIDTLKNKVEVSKMYSDISTLKIDKKNVSQTENTNNVKLETAIITPVLVTAIAKIPDHISQLLKKRKLKYTATYEAKNTVEFLSTKTVLPKLTFERHFYNKNINSQILAMKLVLLPKLIQEGKFFAFKIDTLFFKYSKARIKTKAPIINLSVEITINYKKIEDSTTLNKSEIKSSVIIIPVDLRKENQDTNILKAKLSDTFIPENISEISVKITEVNPYKIKLEELDSFLTNNKEDLSGLFSELSKLLK